MDNLLKDGERLDDIGFGNLRLIQKPEGFCYGIDAVLLATFAQVRKSDRVIDLGTGTGIIPMILSHRTEASEIVGVEVQQESYERGLRNIYLNDLGNRVRLIHGDVKQFIHLDHDRVRLDRDRPTCCIKRRRSNVLDVGSSQRTRRISRVGRQSGGDDA